MGKINVSELAAALVEKYGVGKREAQQFISALVDVIREGIAQDRQVKVKGLGTFKVVEVGARESVNVNTGERVTIDSHSKLTFTPDAAMKELVNKPFSQFETVVLNEGVTFEDMEENAPEEPQEPQETPMEATDASMASEPSMPLMPSKPSEPSEASMPQEEEEPAPTKKPLLRWLPWVAAIIVVFGVGYYLGTMNDKKTPAAPEQQKAKTEQVAANNQTPAANSQTTEQPTANSQEQSTANSEQPTADSQQPTADGQIPAEYLKYEAMDSRVRLGAYYITGLKEIVTLKEGETLRLISRRHFGAEQAMISYIEVYNGFTKDTKLEPGQQIKIPKLETKQSVKRRLKKN